MPERKNKKIYLEVLRALAIIFVVFNHTRQNGYVYFTLYEAGTFRYWFYMVFSVIAGISVPLFYMISGTVLLGKTESVGYVWKKRISKYAVVLLVFSLIIYVLGNYYSGALSVTDFLKRTYSEGVIVPYWFLYSYIGFLIGLPVFRKAVINMTDQEFKYLFGIWIVYNSLIFILQYRFSGGTLRMNELLIPASLTNILFFYPAIGYYLGARLEKVTTQMCIVSLIFATASVAVIMYMTDYKISLTGDLNESSVSYFYDCCRPFQVVCIFVCVRKLFENRKIPAFLEKVILNLGSSVFGIYLIEEMGRDILYSVFLKMCSVINGFAAVWIYVLAVFLLCWFCTASFRFLFCFFRRIIVQRKQSG
ncbi:MAG: acyltransferase family protein [Clostridiales bacterium]|nr:acyltransferase family protein [Clostridiales bacterium]